MRRLAKMTVGGSKYRCPTHDSRFCSRPSVRGNPGETWRPEIDQVSSTLAMIQLYASARFRGFCLGRLNLGIAQSRIAITTKPHEDPPALGEIPHATAFSSSDYRLEISGAMIRCV